MIRETMIDAEREESDEAHDLKLLNVLMKCIEEAVEEGNLFNDDEDDDDDDYYMRMMTMSRTTIMTTVFVCAIQPILKWELAVVMPEARRAMANVAQMDTTGGSNHDHHTFIVSYGGAIVPPKKTPESKRNETFPLKRNEKDVIYISESGLYGLILHSGLESTHVFRFRVAKNLIVF